MLVENRRAAMSGPVVEEVEVRFAVLQCRLNVQMALAAEAGDWRGRIGTSSATVAVTEKTLLTSVKECCPIQ